MRRTQHTYRIITLSVLLLLGGCDHYLNVNPDNRVELNTIDKCAELLTNAYSSAGYTFTEWMSDNVSYTTGTQRLNEHNQSYQWQDITSVNQDTPTNFWTSTYESIAHANEVLAVIDNLEGDSKKRNAVKAEALLTRAYGHFMLVNLFAKDYNEQTASTDPGIPYVSEPETVFLKKYTRQSVKEVYAAIEQDILKGLKNVDGEFYANSGKYHFTKNAALAFASRFYLFKKDYTNCIKYSSQMLATEPASFVKDIDALLSQSVNPDNYTQLYSSPNDASNLLLVRQVTNFPVNVGYWPSPSLFQAIFGDNPWNTDDERVELRVPIYIRGGGNHEGYAIGKYQFLFQRSSITSNVGLYYTIMPVFRGEEVILNRAESYVQTNQNTLALQDLQLLVSKRYLGESISLSVLRTHYQSNNDANNLLQFILDERRKEFMHEGLRWFDIKRYGLAVHHDLSDGSIVTLTADDKRKIIQIPQTAIDVGGLRPNDR
jgi:hypothetical protein